MTPPAGPGGLKATGYESVLRVGAIMRHMRFARFVIVLLAALVMSVLSVRPAAAHPAPFSYLDIVYRNGGIDGTLVIHTIDAAHELKISTPDTLLDPGVLAAQRDALTAILARRILLKGGQPLTPVWTGAEPMRAEQALRLRFRIDGAQPGALTIDTDLFPYDPEASDVHQHLRGRCAPAAADLQSRRRRIHLLRRDDAGCARGDEDVRPVGHSSHSDRSGSHPVSDRPAAAWRDVERARQDRHRVHHRSQHHVVAGGAEHGQSAALASSSRRLR